MMIRMDDLTALFSRVLRERPELQGNRAVDLFIQDNIEIVRRYPQRPEPRPPLAPVDLDDH